MRHSLGEARSRPLVQVLAKTCPRSPLRCPACVVPFRWEETSYERRCCPGQATWKIQRTQMPVAISKVAAVDIFVAQEDVRPHTWIQTRSALSPHPARV